MESIVAPKGLQDITAGQVREMLLREVEHINSSKHEGDQHLNDDLSRIQELEYQIDTLKKSLQQETQTLEHKRQDLAKCLNLLTDLENERNKFLQESKMLEFDKNKLKISKPSMRDQKVLECGRKKLGLYKEFTRIRWDYEALLQNVQGYVTNKRDYVNHFSYNNNSDTLAEDLWGEIKLSTRIIKTAVGCDNKENIASSQKISDFRMEQLDVLV